jgi:hypothetical protein
MRRLRRCVAPAGARALPAVLAVVALASALAGCATSTAAPTPLSLAQVDGNAVRQAHDESSEPFSRNYGPPLLWDRPPECLSEAEADALVARAIAAHEMRRP